MPTEEETNSYEDDNNSVCSQQICDRLPNTNNIIRGQKDAYAVGHMISQGKYGGVYELLRRRDGKRFAAKLEVCGVNTNALNMDYTVLKAASKANYEEHFSTFIDRGKIEGHFRFLVMKMVGENLYKLRLQFEGYRFSAPTALRLSLEMLSALEQLHSLGFVHKDVKPSNFTVLDEDRRTKVYLIDFGLCRQICSHSNDQLKSPRQHTEFRGTTRYASLAAHRSEELSRRDDLESWLYVVTEFMTGELPWSIYGPANKDAIQEAKKNARTVAGATQLFTHCPTEEFVQIMKYLDGLSYYSQPDYNKLQRFINQASVNNDIDCTQSYDWQL